jgi:hypothetical protein
VTDDPISLYRIELRSAAARRASAYQRRRRGAVALAVALAAVVIVGGAIAAQNRWLTQSNPCCELVLHGRRLELRPLAQRLHGMCGRSRMEGEPAACKRIATTCLIPRQPGKRVTLIIRSAGSPLPTTASGCVLAARRGATDALRRALQTAREPSK